MNGAQGLDQFLERSLKINTIRHSSDPAMLQRYKVWPNSNTELKQYFPRTVFEDSWGMGSGYHVGVGLSLKRPITLCSSIVGYFCQGHVTMKPR